MGKKKSKDYYYIPQNSAVWDIVNTMPTVDKRGVFDMTGTNFKVNTEHGEIVMQTNETEGLLVKDILTRTNPSVAQAFMFVLNKYNEVKKSRFRFKAGEYANFKGIANRTANAERLEQDLKTLACTMLRLTVNIKGTLSPVRGNVLAFSIIDKPSKYFEVTLGPIVDSLLEGQYVIVSSECFKYNPKVQRFESIISPKLNERYRTNLKNRTKNKKEWETIGVKTLMNLLHITESHISKRGCVYYEEKLEKALDTIKEKEGFEWEFGKTAHPSIDDFLADTVKFKNIKLDEMYKDYSYKGK